MTTLDKIKGALADRVLKVVSSKTGISENTLSGIKTGRIKAPHASTVAVLARYLGVTE